MAPRDVPAGERNDAAAVPVTEPPTIVPSPTAAESGGAKNIRCSYGDVFVVDDQTTLDGDWAEFPAARAKALIEIAARNGVGIQVADVEKKG